MESDFINAELVKESPTKKLVFISAGEYQNSDFGEKLTFNVQMDGKNKQYRPNRDSVANLAQAWGMNSDNWIGKTATVSAVKTRGKDSVLALPATDAEGKPLSSPEDEEIQ